MLSMQLPSARDQCILIPSCLFGNWSLDVDTLRHIVVEKLQETSWRTARLDITGESKFAVLLPDTNEMTFDAFKVVTEAEIFGASIYFETITLGTATATPMMQSDNGGTGEFYNQNAFVQGESLIKFSPNDPGLSSPLSDDYGQTFQRVTYRCEPERLELSGWPLMGPSSGFTLIRKHYNFFWDG